VATKEAPVSELDRGALHAALESLGEANEAIEEFWRRLKDAERVDREAAWLLTGFTDDALLDLSEITRHVIEIRSKIKGGLTEKESNLQEAFENV
jgi:hypothetical protein